MESKNQFETRIIQELTADFKLVDILTMTHFSTSTYCYWIKKIKQDNQNQVLEELILIIFNENNESYGYRRITLELYNRGLRVNEKKVYRLMKKLELTCVKYSHKTRKYGLYKGTVGVVAFIHHMLIKS